MRFTGSEGQQMFLTVEPSGLEAGSPSVNDDIPSEFAIRGLGPVKLTVANAEELEKCITKYLKQALRTLVSWNASILKLFTLESGIMFEILTDGPGFTVDEGVEEFGRLAFPPFLEHKRAEVEQRLSS